MSEETEAEFGLVMPFVVCASQGGPYDDAAFVAGYELGHLAARLESGRHHFLRVTLHTASMPQVDLLAMKCGYTMRYQVMPQDEWSDVEFTKPTP